MLGMMGGTIDCLDQTRKTGGVLGLLSHFGIRMLQNQKY